MKKVFVFSDPHGEFDCLWNALKFHNFDIHNDNHILLGLGDYFDRGFQNLEMFYFLNQMRLKKRAYLIRGNHEDMLIDFLTKRMHIRTNLTYNGLDKTVLSLAKIQDINGKPIKYFNAHQIIVNADFYSKEILKKHTGLLEFLFSLKNCYEYDDKLIFCHAGFTKMIGNWYPDNWTITPNWIKEFDTGNKTIYFGHWWAKSLNEIFLPKLVKENRTKQIFRYKNFVGLDAQSNLSQKVFIEVIDMDLDKLKDCF
jgi:serine/threonine protein phosphatase 1